MSPALADELSPELLRYELEQAWALMRHHEQRAGMAERETVSVREHNARMLPKVNAFNMIARTVESWEKHHNDETAILHIAECVRRGRAEAVAAEEMIAKRKARQS